MITRPMSNRFPSQVFALISHIAEAAILLTVPNDSYLYKRCTNPNMEKVRKVILDLAGEYGCGVYTGRGPVFLGFSQRP